jgi:zinc transporter 9
MFWHLFAYTLTTPLFSLVSYLVLSAVTTGEGVSEKTLVLLDYWIGLALLLSVGTFLFVTTMHILPEVYDMSEPKKLSHSHGH